VYEYIHVQLSIQTDLQEQHKVEFELRVQEQYCIIILPGIIGEILCVLVLVQTGDITLILSVIQEVDSCSLTTQNQRLSQCHL